MEMVSLIRIFAHEIKVNPDLAVLLMASTDLSPCWTHKLFLLVLINNCYNATSRLRV